LSNGEKKPAPSLTLSEQQKAFLDTALTEYQDQLSQDDAAQDYLRNRGLSADKQAYFRLGYINEAVPGHEKFTGRIVIPYLTRAGVVGMKFRAIEDRKDKYLNLPRQAPRIFNPAGFFSDKPYIAICEGEIDAMTAHSRLLPAVGLPGVSSWQEWFARPFIGYETIYVLADNDDKGQGAKFADEIAERLENVRTILMPEGMDVNKYVTENSHDALLERVGIHV
jgi:DNA primase